MAIPRYLAMTAAEMRAVSDLPAEAAWMACHFSPYGTGLSNLPSTLPPDSLLILNDRTPIHGHDGERVAKQLQERIEALHCKGLLLDFQRPEEPETAALVKHLTGALSCPVTVSDLYARGLDCPVFLPPAPPEVSLETYLAPWQGREIWLEMALGGEVISLTEQGAQVSPLPHPPGDGQAETRLHCHYQISVSDTEVEFPLWRTAEDLEALLAEAERLGVTAAVGLYQELQNFAAPKASPLGEGGTA